MARVLVADDQLAWRLLIAEALKQAGYDVVTAKNGDQALAQCLEVTCPPAMAILDNQMGQGPTGLEVAARIAGQVPFVMMSADPKVEEECLRLGGLAFFDKSMGPDALMAGVEQVLQRLV